MEKTMLVLFKGDFRGNSSVSFRGEVFEPGKPSEVSQAWYENCQGMCEMYSKPKPKPKPKPKAKSA